MKQLKFFAFLVIGLTRCKSNRPEQIPFATVPIPVFQLNPKNAAVSLAFLNDKYEIVDVDSISVKEIPLDAQRGDSNYHPFLTVLRDRLQLSAKPLKLSRYFSAAKQDLVFKVRDRSFVKENTENVITISRWIFQNPQQSQLFFDLFHFSDYPFSNCRYKCLIQLLKYENQIYFLEIHDSDGDGLRYEKKEQSLLLLSKQVQRNLFASSLLKVENTVVDWKFDTLAR